MNHIEFISQKITGSTRAGNHVFRTPELASVFVRALNNAGFSSRRLTPIVDEMGTWYTVQVN